MRARRVIHWKRSSRFYRWNHGIISIVLRCWSPNSNKIRGAVKTGRSGFFFSFDFLLCLSPNTGFRFTVCRGSTRDSGHVVMASSGRAPAFTVDRVSYLLGISVHKYGNMEFPGMSDGQAASAPAGMKCLLLERGAGMHRLHEVVPDHSSTRGARGETRSVSEPFIVAATTMTRSSVCVV